MSGSSCRRISITPMAEEEAIKVAVRVRPFSKREKRCIVEMPNQQSVVITDPAAYFNHAELSEELDVWQTRFHFDRCFWSHDDNGNQELAGQQEVFDSYGPWIIENAVKGYNCSLFAYGQTGSGKTYTMMGNDNDVGFIPRLCHYLFEMLHQGKKEDPTTTIHVESSYFEIYNERVFDLLNTNHTASLRVREHPKTGAYVEDLFSIAVTSYEEIEALLKEGANARRVAETKMNKESSRSHAIFQLLLRSKKTLEGGRSVEKISKLYLVDLAGSERVSTSGATGVRLKEAANINKSLSALSDVIKALTTNPGSSASGSSSPNGSHDDHQRFIPYRNSSLTWLLKESLGGNAKTVMFATISPDLSNYQESLSTLKYAERAKKIVNKARVNKESNAVLVEALQNEIAALRDQLAKYEKSDKGNEKEGQAVLRRLHSQQKLVETLSTSWEEKLEIAENHFAKERLALEKEMERLRAEQLERQEEEERRKQERQDRQKEHLEQQMKKRRAEQNKQVEQQRKLDELNQLMEQLLFKLQEKEKHIENVEALLQASNQSKQEVEERVAKERQKMETNMIKQQRILAKERREREELLRSLYHQLLTKEDIESPTHSQDAKEEENEGSNKVEEEDLLKRMESAIGKHLQENEQLKDKLNQVEGQWEAKLLSLGQSIKMYENTLKNERTKFAQQTQQLETMEQANQVLQSKHAQVEQELEAMKTDLEQMNEVLQSKHELGTENQVLQSKHTQAVQELESMKRELDLTRETHQRELKDTKEDLDKAKELETSLRRELSVYQEKLAQIESLKANLEIEVRTERSERERLEGELLSTQKELKDLHEENQGFKESQRDALEKGKSEVRSLKAELEDVKARHEQDLEQEKASIKQEQEKQAHLQEKVDSLQDELVALKGEKILMEQEQEKQVHLFRSEIDSLQSEVHAVKNHEKVAQAQWQDEIDSLKEHVHVKERKLGEMEELLSQAEKAKQMVDKELGETKEQLAEFVVLQEKREQIMEQLKENHEQTLHELKVKHDEALQQERESLQAKLEKTSASSQRQLETELKQMKEAHAMELASLKEQLEDAKQFETKTKEMEKTIEWMKTQKSEAQVQMIAVQSSLDDKVAQLSSLQNILQETNKERRSTEEELAKLKEENFKISRDLQTKVTECQHWKKIEVDQLTVKSKLELDLLSVQDQLDTIKEREKTLSDKLDKINAVHEIQLEELRNEAQQKQRIAQNEITWLQKQLEESNWKLECLSQQVENERKAFDQIVKAQSEVLTYSQFPKCRSPTSPKLSRSTSTIYEQRRQLGSTSTPRGTSSNSTIFEEKITDLEPPSPRPKTSSPKFRLSIQRRGSTFN